MMLAILILCSLALFCDASSLVIRFIEWRQKTAYYHKLEEALKGALFVTTPTTTMSYGVYSTKGGSQEGH